MAEYLIQEQTLKSIADSIRHVTGKTGDITVSNMPIEIGQIETGGTVLPTLTNEATASDLVSGKELIDDEGNVIVGTMANNGQISSTMDGINTKSIAVPAGYTSGGTVSLDNTIDNEVAIQADLIAQIMSALESKTGYNTIYVGSSAPTDDIGVNGDIYIVRSGG